MQEYKVTIPQFEGPFDLLLFFIERDELDIREVSLASLTEDFLNYIHGLSNTDLELGGEFIWVAATLMKIKAKHLLPRIRPAEELSDEIDTEQKLLERLIEYKKYKDKLPYFLVLEETRSLQFSRENLALDWERLSNSRDLKKDSDSLEELQNLTLYQILKSYKKVIFRNLERKNISNHTIISPTYTIEQQKNSIVEWIKLSKRIDFLLIQKHAANKLELVYAFLAVLELIQEKVLKIDIGQGTNNFWLSFLS